MASDQKPLQVSRREVLVGAAGGVAAALTAGAHAAEAPGAVVSGVVFEDRSGTGHRGADDPGVSNVLVSNGRDVAVTDAQGRYALPLPDEAIIFVVKPSGFTPPIDAATQAPRFYRIHHPGDRPLRSALNSKASRRPRHCPPRSIFRCGDKTSPANSKSSSSPTRSRNRTRKSISSART